MAYIAFTGHQDRITTEEALDLVAKDHADDIWVHGGAVGFDTQVDNYAKRHGIAILVIRPDYVKYKHNPKFAPLARDEEIVDRSDILYACYDGREHGGTAFTVKYAKTLGKEVHILPICIAS